jgi:chorismate mutase
MKKENEVNSLRGLIDEIDDQLLHQFNQRAELVLKLARKKRSIGKKLFDPERERDIFVRITEENPGPLPPESVVRLFERIIDESRRLERTEVYEKDKE